MIESSLPPLLTFVVPVRHPDNTRDWARQRAILVQTVAAIARQTASAWRAVIVANHGADLPPLPAGFDVVRVDFPANPHPSVRHAPKELVYETFRLDKGRRVLAGMLTQRDSRFFMIVDDDDLVSNRLVEFAANHRNANGWEITRGYVWPDGGRLLLEHHKFDTTCGSCLLIRSDLYALPLRAEDATEDYIKNMLGSHRSIAAILARRHTPLSPLPFPGAIYRIGHGSNVSAKNGLFSVYFNTPHLRRHPWILLQTLTRLRWLTQRIKKEFFATETGATAGSKG